MHPPLPPLSPPKPLSHSTFHLFRILSFSLILLPPSLSETSMGFPVGYTEVFFPNIFIHTLSVLGFIRSLIFTFFHFLGIADFFETEVVWSDSQIRVPENPPVSALLIREFLPVVKFGDLPASACSAGISPESCAVCLYEFEAEEEIRCLTNCKHIFHRACLDRWMDHDQKTCPLCRTPFVPDDMQDEYNQRLWAASGVNDFYAEYSSSV